MASKRKSDFDETPGDQAETDQTAETSAQDGAQEGLPEDAPMGAETDPAPLEAAESDDADAIEADTIEKAEIVEDAEIIEEIAPDVVDSNAAPEDDVTGDAAEDADDSDPGTDEIAAVDEPADSESADLADIEEVTATPEPAPVAPPAPAKRRGMPALLGGAVAAVLGYVLAQVVPAGWPVTPDPAVTNALAEKDAALETRSEELETRSQDLSDRIATLEAVDPTAALVPVQDQLSTLEGQLSAQLSALTDRITALEDRPIIDLSSLDNSEAFEAELEKLRGEIADVSEAAQAQIAAARNEATLLEQNALEAAQAAARRAALSRVLAALDSGEAYAETLAEFMELTDAEIPAGLAAGADDGVPTLAVLQADYPPLAREALSAMRRSNEGGENTLTNFFQTQFGVRSLEPQEGDGPDAILSRIEAAIVAGNLPDALSEAATLPEVGAEVLAPWVASVELRAAAFDGAAAVTQTMTTN